MPSPNGRDVATGVTQYRHGQYLELLGRDSLWGEE